MTGPQSLPPTQRALVLETLGGPLAIKTVPIPQVGPGSAVVKIISAGVLPYAREIYKGVRQNPLATPLITGSGAVGRVVAVGPDATSLAPGQLVLVDIFIRGRDNPTAAILLGHHGGLSEGSKKLMWGEWRDATYAEYAKVPLENCTALNEERLTGPVDEGGLGYHINELPYMLRMLVAYGGFRDIDLKAGETIVVAPATGSFGGAAVEVAAAMGARVIAAGRNIEVLKKIAATSDRIEIAQMTMDVEKDVATLRKFGEIDCFLDLSPRAAAGSTHIESCLMTLKTHGRASFMGAIAGVSLPYSLLMLKSIQIKFKWMYQPEDIRGLVKLVEAGILKIGECAGHQPVGKFALEEWDKAFTNAEKINGWGVSTLIAP